MQDIFFPVQQFYKLTEEDKKTFGWFFRCMGTCVDVLDFTLTDDEMRAIAGLDTGRSPIYDDMDLATVKSIGLHKIHD